MVCTRMQRALKATPGIEQALDLVQAFGLAHRCSRLEIVSPLVGMVARRRPGPSALAATLLPASR
jgi:hypothetical protein